MNERTWKIAISAHQMNSSAAPPASGSSRRRQRSRVAAPRSSASSVASSGTVSGIGQLARHQQVSSTARRCAACAVNSAVSRIDRRRGSGRSIVTISRTRPGRAGQHQHLLAEKRRLVDAVGDEHDRRAGLAPDAQQFLVQPVAGDLVQRAERLIHQQHARSAQQRARDRHALAHAARQLVRQRLLPARQSDQRQQVLRPHRARRQLMPPAHLQRQADVVKCVAPGQQGGVLEHEADLAVSPGLRRRLRQHPHAAGRGRHDIGDHPQQRRFAAA